MKLLHTAHSKAQGTKAAEGTNNLFSALGNAKDPKSVVALKADPKYANINFDHVLSAAEKGHDPKAMADLLVKEQNSEKSANLPFAKNSEKNLGSKKLGTEKLVSQEATPVKIQQKPKSILSPMKDLQAKSQVNPQAAVTQNTGTQELTAAGKAQVAQRPTAQVNTAHVQIHGQPVKAQTGQAQVAQNKTAQTEQPARRSIFATDRVLNIQSKSQYAAPQVQSQQALITQAAQLASPVMVGTQPKMQTQAFRSQNQDLVEMRGLRRNNNLKSGYQTKSQSMIKTIDQAPKTVESKTVDMLETQKSVDLGESAQRFSGNEFSQVANQNLGQTAQAATAGKVLNLNQTQLSSNTETVINQIQNYVVQAQANNQSEVSMSFEHQDLGQVDLMVQKLDPKSNQLNIQIATRGSEAAEFFKTHQGELLNTLSRSGLQIADLKLDSANSSNNQQDLAGNSDQKGQEFAGRGQKQSEQGQRDADQQRRQDLWDQFYENKEAA